MFAYITDVNIPEGTRLLVGRIGPRPSFGLTEESGFQCQVIDQLPEESLMNTSKIF